MFNQVTCETNGSKSEKKLYCYCKKPNDENLEMLNENINGFISPVQKSNKHQRVSIHINTYIHILRNLKFQTTFVI